MFLGALCTGTLCTLRRSRLEVVDAGWRAGHDRLRRCLQKCVLVVRGMVKSGFRFDSCRRSIRRDDDQSVKSRVGAEPLLHRLAGNLDSVGKSKPRENADVPPRHIDLEPA
jgi:hypothetical protein